MDGSLASSAGTLFTMLVSSVMHGPTTAAASLLPPTYGLLSTFILDQDGHDGGDSSRWSSFIGIVTAICGNILISFALNIQRYAHIRIEREAESERVRLGTRRQGASSRFSSSAYGSVNVPDGVDAEIRRPMANGSYERNQQGAPDSGGLYRIDDREVDEHDHMQHSFLSDRTVKPGERDLAQGDRASYLRSPYWWSGIVLMTLGEAGNFLAYGFAPASIVSPLGVVALISNCVIAPFMLKERFRKRDLWGIVIAVAGVVVVILSANTSETKIGPHEIWIMITRWEFELYLGLTAALIVTLMSLSDKYGGRTILIDLGLVGLFGGYTALSTKGVASLLSFTLWHVITFPVTYLLVAVLVFSALMQIRYINRALQRFDSTQVIPIQFVLFTLSVITGSAILYRDFESTTGSQAGKFVGGCFLTFLGVYLITSGRVRREDEYSEEGDEEEAIGLLREERYQDEVHRPPPGLDRRTRESGQTETDEDLTRSPRVSLLSEGSDGHEGDPRTPRGVLSPTGSHDGTFSGRSLSPASRDECTSPSRPRSLIENPWAASPEPAVKSSVSDPTAPRTVSATPPGQSSQPSQASEHSQILFRFPAAPTTDEPTPLTDGENHAAGRGSLLPSVHIRTPEQRHLGTPRTPQSNSRNSLSMRLTPGPLLNPLSSTLSAVVADSLRRGEGSPGRHRRVKSRGRKRLGSVPVIEGDANRDATGDGETEYETEASVDDVHHSSTAITDTLASSRFNSTRDTDGRNNTTITRLRSLSDSWSGGLAWLGAPFRRPKGRKAVPNQHNGEDANEEDRDQDRDREQEQAQRVG